MTREEYEQHIAGDFGCLTDTQLRYMKTQIESDRDIVKKDDLVELLALCDAAIASIERGER